MRVRLRSDEIFRAICMVFVEPRSGHASPNDGCSSSNMPVLVARFAALSHWASMLCKQTEINSIPASLGFKKLITGHPVIKRTAYLWVGATVTHFHQEFGNCKEQVSVSIIGANALLKPIHLFPEIVPFWSGRDYKINTVRNPLFLCDVQATLGRNVMAASDVGAHHTYALHGKLVTSAQTTPTHVQARLARNAAIYKVPQYVPLPQYAVQPTLHLVHGIHDPNHLLGVATEQEHIRSRPVRVEFPATILFVLNHKPHTIQILGQIRDFLKNCRTIYDPTLLRLIILPYQYGIKWYKKAELHGSWTFAWLDIGRRSRNRPITPCGACPID